MLRCDFKSWYALCVRARVCECALNVCIGVASTVSLSVSRCESFTWRKFKLSFFSSASLSQRTKNKRGENQVKFITLWILVKIKRDSVCYEWNANWHWQNESNNAVYYVHAYIILYNACFKVFTWLHFFPFKKFMSNSRRCTTVNSTHTHTPCETTNQFTEAALTKLKNTQQNYIYKFIVGSLAKLTVRSRIEMAQRRKKS